jgi:hypothetical protein
MSKVILKNGAIITLSQLINLDGWAKGYQLMYRAGKFLSEVLPELTAPWISPTNPTETDVNNQQAWNNQDGPEFELSDEDAELCRECFKKLAETERLRPSKWTKAIQDAIKLTTAAK